MELTLGMAEREAKKELLHYPQWREANKEEEDIQIIVQNDAIVYIFVLTHICIKSCK